MVFMDVYCCFSFITHQQCLVSSLTEVMNLESMYFGHSIVSEGVCWHGFVMWAAIDWRDRLPFDAQEVQ